MTEKNDKTKHDDKWDFIVIGGGINGLSIGALLSHTGKKVLLVEKEQQLGGRATVTEYMGYTLDNGLHLMSFGWKSALNDVLRVIKGKENKKLYIKPIRSYYLYLGDKIKGLKPNVYEKRKIKWFNKGWITVPRNINQMRKSDYFGVWKLIRIFTTGFKIDFDVIKDKSLQQFINEKKMNETCTQYMRLAAGAMIHCPYLDVVSAGEVIRIIKYGSKMPVLFGYPSGGWNEIIKILKQAIETNGKIITSLQVKRLLIEENPDYRKNAELKSEMKYQCKGILTDKGEFRSNNAVIAIPPKFLPPMFISEDNKNFLDIKLKNFIKNIIPTGGITIDYGLKKRVYKGKSFLYVEDPDGYGVLLSNIEPSLAPEGKQLISFYFPVCKEDRDDLKKVEIIKEVCRNKILALFPKIMENLDFERIKFHKSADSLQISYKQYYDTRPEPQVPGIKGCFLTGDYLKAYGAGRELGYNAVWETFRKIQSIQSENFRKTENSESHHIIEKPAQQE